MKLFRHHRGSLADSLKTTIEVQGLDDMRQYLTDYWNGYLSNIRIQGRDLKDHRLPAEWNGVSYYVVADFADGGWGCIGMTNFYEL